MIWSFFLSSALLVMRAAAQVATPYTDEKSGITFNGYTDKTGYRMGIALPENPTTDLIAQIVVPVSNDGGWGGFALGSTMVGSLLIVAWPHEDQIVSSFRKATGYTSPPATNGTFSMTTIPGGTYVNDTAFSYTFLCSNCIGTDALVLSDTSNVFGWAYSDDAVTDPTSTSSALTYHSAGFALFGFTVDDAKNANFDTWAALATGSSGNSTSPVSGGGPSNGTAGGNTTTTVSNSTYDYIVAGAGAGGLVVAERLAESGASVLLLERGGPSFGATGNNDTLSWNSSVTIYDVPGLDYYLSQAGNPAFCTDTADQAGCLLGGGTVVNAMMFVKPQSRDFDDSWPEGWKWNDVAEAADRVYARNPGQTYGSEDGLRYNNEAYDVLSKFLAASGWTDTDFINGDHNARVDAYGYPPWNLADGMRSGVVRTYLPVAQSLPNFKLMLNTKVVRAVRNGSTITGVETETSAGARVIYNVKAGGSVILAAGTMSTPRILFNSGIGPAEQLQTVASGTTGVTLPAESDWIDLPVGAEIKDHVIFTLRFNTSVPLYSPPTSDIISPNQTVVDLFAKGNGVLAQSGQRLNFWTNVTTSSGKEMFIQGTCNGPANNTIQMKIYLSHGLTSIGSLGITADGATELTKTPWLNTDEDVEAISLFMQRLLDMTRAPNSTLSFRSAGTTTTATANMTGAELVQSVMANKEYTTGIHYVGTAKMGTKGDAGVVVDSDTKVYGTNNLFVVDGSMHPDLPTGNTQAIIMVAAEAAAQRILALNGGGSANQTTVPTATSAAGTATVTAVLSALPPNSTGTAAVTSGEPPPTETKTTALSPAAQTSQPAGRPGNNNRPGWGHGHGGQHRSSTTLKTRSPTPTPTPTATRAGIRYLSKRQLAERKPVSPEVVEDEEAIAERIRMERASFLDSYKY